MKIIYGKAEECPLIVKKEQESPADLDSEIRAIIRKDFNITDEKELDALVKQVKERI